MKFTEHALLNSRTSLPKTISGSRFSNLQPLHFSLVSLFTAAIYFFTLFNLSFVTQGRFWRSAVGDNVQHLVGYYAFVRDAWRFPLFYTQNLAYPHGANIIFTDSIPILSLIFKLVRGVIPNTFHPFGLWILLCYLLLAHAFASLQYELGHRSLWSAAASSLFVVLSPILLFRIQLNHAALCGQFLVAYALLLYVKDYRRQKTSWAWLVLLVIALLTHAYLFAMVAALYAASLLSVVWQRNAARRDVAKNAAVTVGSLAVVISISGFFAQHVLLTDPLGYGHYSMNLLSPFSIHYANYDATGGQLDGFNYWGAGTLLLLMMAAAPALYRSRRRLSGGVIAGMVCLAGFTLFAVSNRIYVGHHLLFSYPLPGVLARFTEIFRSSGRFFWPVSYAVMALAVWGALELRPALAIIILLAAIAAQWIDTQPMRATVRQMTAAPVAAPIGDRFREIVKAHDLVTLVPPAQCHLPDGLYSGPGLAAAESGVKLASVWAGRYAMDVLEPCRSLNRDLLAKGFDHGELYFFNTAAFRSVRVRPDLAKFCSQLDGYNLCTTRRAELELPPVGDSWRPPLWFSEAPVKADQIADSLGIGWSYFEGSVIWSVGYQSELLFRLPSCGAAKAVRVRFLPMTGPQGQTVTASVNGGTAVSGHYSQRVLYDLEIPLDRCDPAQPDMLATFRTEKPVSTLELGESRDSRPLGIMLVEAQLLVSYPRP